MMKTMDQKEMNKMLEGATTENIFAGAMNTERNKKFLKNVPHVNICDLSVVFFVANSTGHALLLNRTLMKALCTDDVQVLSQIAEESSPMRIRSVEAILEEAMDEEIPPADNGLWAVQTPVHETYGAGSIVYPHFFEKVTEKTGEQFWLLPSSKSEFLAVPDNGAFKEQELFEMVCDINRTQLTPNEFLSDNVYHWDGHVLTDHFGRETIFA